MKTKSRIRSGLLLFAGLGIVVLAAFALSVFQVPAMAAPNPSKSSGPDPSDFFSDTARLQRDPGTPVGPPKKIIICHNGRTISVGEKAVPAHLAHGDTLGPCLGDYVICHKYPNFDPDHAHVPYRTIIVSQKDLASYLALGDTMGPCPNQAFMCTRKNRTIVVPSQNVSDHLSRGQQLGLCPGKTLLCHKNHTIVVEDSSLPAHLAHGDCIGYCYGSAGPLVSQTMTCSSNPPTAFAGH
jgi:hypothetical protein